MVLAPIFICLPVTLDPRLGFQPIDGLGQMEHEGHIFHHMPVMQFRRQPLQEAERRYFTAARDAMALPDLIEIQKASYRWFLEEGIRELSQ